MLESFILCNNRLLNSLDVMKPNAHQIHILLDVNLIIIPIFDESPYLRQHIDPSQKICGGGRSQNLFTKSLDYFGE